MKFNILPLRQTLIQALDAMALTEMTEIQEKAIPEMLEGRDVIGRSQTGTGKTMAFAVPAVSKIKAADRFPQVLVLLPTRELAIQVAGEFRKLLQFEQGIKVALLFGGERFDHQLKALQAGAQVVVGTPGRTLDHLGRKTLSLHGLQMAILDEADEMLDMGFREDIEKILSQIGHPVQTALFSATMPQPILDMAKRFQDHPVKIEVAPKRMVAAGIDQRLYVVKKGQKLEALTRLLEVFQMQKALIFCNTKRAVDEVSLQLIDQGCVVSKLHGDIDQRTRQAVLGRFTRARQGALVATDVAARGIDIDDIDLVINYDVPENPENYVHRIGRTGRAGRTGLSLTLAQNRDRFHLDKIERYTKKKMTLHRIPTGKEMADLKVENMLAKLTEDCAEIAAENQKLTGQAEKIIAPLKAMGYADAVIEQALLRQFVPEGDGKRSDINASIQSVQDKKGKPRRSRRTKMENGVRVMISAGKKDGVKKGDILGAICGESGISSDEVGDIAVFGHFSTAVIAEDSAPKVVIAVDGARVKGHVVSASVAGQKKDKKNRKSKHSRHKKHHTHKTNKKKPK
ncbi:MAG: DEAD/DEAH box helicase [Pseudoramibacter sp.]